MQKFFAFGKHSPPVLIIIIHVNVESQKRKFSAVGDIVIFGQ